MNDTEHYADPALARRVRDWIDEAAPPAAPERLVYAVMDEVGAQPARRLPRLWPGLQTVSQYVALLIVVVIGVAIGIRLAGWGTVASSPTPSPAPGGSPAAPSPSHSPGEPVPSLVTIDRRTFSRAPGPSAIGVTGSSIWVGTPDAEIVELDVATGAERSRADVRAEPITIIPYDGILWIGSGGPDLAWLDPASHQVGTIPGAGGHFVLSAAGSLWVSRTNEFLQIDPRTRTVVGSLPVAGHLASDVGSIVGDELWTGAGASMVRLALPGGSVLGTIRAQPSALLQAPAGIFADDGGTLVQLAGPDGAGVLDPPARLLDGLPDAYGQASDGDRLWVAGRPPDGAGQVVEIDLATMRIASRTLVGGGPRALALVDHSLWVAVDSGALVRLGLP